jgi:hypothetical protein
VIGLKESLDLERMTLSCSTMYDTLHKCLIWNTWIGRNNSSISR